jgi:hypothetical protein
VGAEPAGEPTYASAAATGITAIAAATAPPTTNGFMIFNFLNMRGKIPTSTSVQNIVFETFFGPNLSADGSRH